MVLILRNSRTAADSELDDAPVRSKQRSRYYDNGRGRLNSSRRIFAVPPFGSPFVSAVPPSSLASFSHAIRPVT
ncbi:hypothetical protein P8452_56336 [Trifolium repens]|nr:hypothetical protein P8452_56336 [Trifolium repens]